MKKTLFNVNPWNDLYYNNCYYSALFAMLMHYNKSISPVLLSNIFFYEKKEDNIKLERKSIFEDNNYDVVKEMGITETVYTKVDDVIQCIKQCIDRDTLPMLWIDCYYETIRPDAYLKNHWVHILLVYGYDDETKTVEFLEHSYTDSFTYKRAHMSYEDIARAHSGYINNMTHEDFKGFIEFKKEDENIDVSKYTVETTKKYIEKMIENKETAYIGINNLYDTIMEWDSLFTDTEDRYKQIKCLEQINKYKQMERYNFKKALNAPDDIINLSTDILMQWRNIYGLYTCVFDEQKSHKEISKCLREVHKSEKALLDKVYEFLYLKQKQMNYTTIMLEPYNNGISISKKPNSIIPETLPDSDIINFEGVPIRMPDKSDDINDHMILYGQKISLKPEKYIRIYLLGVGEVTSKIEMYSKGDKVSEATIFFHDAWTGIDIWEAGPQDKRIIAKLKCQGMEGAVQSMYLMEVDINGHKEFDEIRMPLSPAIKIYGITLEYED